jgi:hypothetical protein
MTTDGEDADMTLPDDRNDVPVEATPEYLAMLRRVSGRAPTADVDWEAFHERLNARAELALVRLRTANARNSGARARSQGKRRAASWWEYTARPSRVWRPIAAAAAIAVAAGIHAWRSDMVAIDGSDVTSVAMSDLAGAQGAFESAVTGGTSSGSIASYLVPASRDAVSAAGSDSSTAK